MDYRYSQNFQNFEVREMWFEYDFINPLLECNIDYEYYNPGPIKQNIQEYIDTSIKNGEVTEVAYYVRLLKNGTNFWYNEDTKFVPASLAKVPIAISLLKNFSEQDLFTEITIPVDSDVSFKRNIGSDTTIPGETYSINTLLINMLVTSDNTATDAIFKYIGIPNAIKTYQKLWLGTVSFLMDRPTYISVKKYSSFFRILYNASYLSRDNSEKLLSILSRSEFVDGIRWGIPTGIRVSNKFWEVSFPTWEKQIHDCGNVYLKNSPYLLCIMTRWNDFEKQLQVIRNISYKIYQDVVSK